MAVEDSDFYKLHKVKDLFEADCKALEEALADNPHNGTEGWWKVSGVRHSALVKASSAPQAKEISSDVVGDWEVLKVEFLGKELPNVLRLS